MTNNTAEDHIHQIKSFDNSQESPFKVRKRLSRFVLSILAALLVALLSSPTFLPTNHSNTPFQTVSLPDPFTPDRLIKEQVIPTSQDFSPLKSTWTNILQQFLAFKPVF